MGVPVSPRPRPIGDGHPEKPFFGPEETAPVEDLVHVIGDGIIVVRYRSDLPREDVTALRDFVAAPQSQYASSPPPRR